jgi:hypothetical protein
MQQGLEWDCNHLEVSKMAIHIRCKGCGAAYDVPDERVGQTVWCRCGAGVSVPQAAQESAPVGETASPTPENVAVIRAEIERWRRDGLISPRLAERLRAEYDPHRSPINRPAAAPGEDWSQFRITMTPGMVLLFLGGILIFCAVAMLVAEFWKDLGNGGRFLLALLPTGILYAAGASLHVRAPKQRVMAAVMLFFACILVPLTLGMGMVWLFGDTYVSGASETRWFILAALTLAIHLATLSLFRSPALTIPYPLSFLWVALQGAQIGHSGHYAGQDRIISGAVLVAGLLLLAVGYFMAERKRPAYAVMPDLAGSFATLTALAALGADGHQPVWEFLSIVASLGAIAASCYRKNQTFLFVGALFLIVNIFSIGFEYFANTTGMPVTLLLCGALSMAAGYGIQRVRKEFILEE